MNYHVMIPPISQILRSHWPPSLRAGFVMSLVLGNVCPHSQKLSYRCLDVGVRVICRGSQQVL